MEEIIYYKGREFSLIEELDAGLVRIKSTGSSPEIRIVEKKYIKTKEQYEKEFKEKPFGRHDVWIN